MRGRANIAGADLRRMTGVERRYALELEGEIRAGAVARWEFQAITLRLGWRCRYTPDFYVVNDQGTIFLDEIKTSWPAPERGEGAVREGWTEDSRVKIKAAAEAYPAFVFRAAIWLADEKKWRRYEIPWNSSLSGERQRSRS